MKNILIIILSAFVFNIAFAQTDLADAEFVKLTKTYTLNEDGSMSYRYYKELKLLTHSAFNRFYGETFVIFDPDFQELTINESYTIMADGKRVDAPDNAFNEVLPRGAAHSATFNNLREMVITHTGLELGATIYLDYTLTTKKGFWPALMGNEIIQETSPVSEMEIKFQVPSDVELQHKMLNLRTGPEVMVKGSQKEYTWKFKGLKASAKESFQGDSPGIPRLSFSTEQKTAVVLDWVMNQKAFDFTANEDMMKFVDDQRDSDEILTMLSIQEEVVNNIKYDRVPMSWVGFKVRTPVEIWESNGGNQLEKAVLLASLLKLADFNAVPVLIAPRRFYDERVASLMIFENAAVMVNTKNQGTMYLSVGEMNKQSLEFSMGGDVVLPMYKDADNSAKEISAGKTEIVLSAEMRISSDLTLTGDAEAELYGATNPFLLLAKDSQNLKSIISGGVVAKGEESVKVLSSNPAKTVAQIKIEKEKVAGEDLGYYQWSIPEMSNGFKSWHISYLSSDRKDDFVLPFALREYYEYEIEIPAGFEFVNEKQAVNHKSKAGSVKIELSPKGNTISIKRELNLNTQVISVEDYADFRTLINEWLDENMKTLVFRKAVDSRK